MENPPLTYSASVRQTSVGFAASWHRSTQSRTFCRHKQKVANLIVRGTLNAHGIGYQKSVSSLSVRVTPSALVRSIRLARCSTVAFQCDGVTGS